MNAIKRWFIPFLLAVIFAGPTLADEIKFQKISLVHAETSWNLNAEIKFELSPALDKLVQKGVPLQFITEFQLSKSRWYWFDEKLIEVQRVSKISYQALTDKYRVTIGSFSFSAGNLSQAIAAIGTVDGWPVIDAGAVNNNQTYQAAVRMRLDTSYLAKPFQVNAINSKDWNLQSEWVKFEFSPKLSQPSGVVAP
jgi:hypothetical protein